MHTHDSSTSFQPALGQNIPLRIVYVCAGHRSSLCVGYPLQIKDTIIGAITDDTLVSSSAELSETTAVRRVWGWDFSGGTYIVRTETCRRVHNPEHEKVSSTALSTASPTEKNGCRIE